jgi:ribonuclease VapC
VDASALIAIVAEERDAATLTHALKSDEYRLVSAMSVWETVSGLCRSYAFSIPQARVHVQRYLDAGEFRMVIIGERELDLAMDAYARYGKGRHRARLNMGDCFAYACARANNARLLYTGDDFSHTDLV